MDSVWVEFGLGSASCGPRPTGTGCASTSMPCSQPCGRRATLGWLSQYLRMLKSKHGNTMGIRRKAGRKEEQLPKSEGEDAANDNPCEWAGERMPVDSDSEAGFADPRSAWEAYVVSFRTALETVCLENHVSLEHAALLIYSFLPVSPESSFPWCVVGDALVERLSGPRTLRVPLDKGWMLSDRH